MVQKQKRITFFTGINVATEHEAGSNYISLKRYLAKGSGGIETQFLGEKLNQLCCMHAAYTTYAYICYSAMCHIMCSIQFQKSCCFDFILCHERIEQMSCEIQPEGTGYGFESIKSNAVVNVVMILTDGDFDDFS